MPKFRTKPREVVAEQFHAYPADGEGWPKGVEVEDGGGPFVTTAHGQRVYLENGDWVIAEPDGRGYYPCKPDIFADRYEACE